MKNFEIDELKEIIDLLESAGLSPMLCDTPIPVSVASARCGLPTEIGDESIDDNLFIPKSLVGQNPEMYIPAVGDSMIDAGIEEGDLHGFCNRVKSLLPESTKLPDAKELARIEVQSFAKPVPLWSENNAPVSGARFYEYQRIALLMGSYLTEKMVKN